MTDLNLPELPADLYFKAGDREGYGRGGKYMYLESHIPGISLRKKPFGKVVARTQYVIDFTSSADILAGAEALLARYRKDQAKQAKIDEAKKTLNNHGKTKVFKSGQGK